jgi:thiaminase/transcriptional activator TenA
MGYGEIGVRLGAQSVETPYRSWIDTYASPDYQQVCVDVGALIDTVVARTLGVDPVQNPRWSGLCASFTKATALEIDFWQLGFEAT